MFPARSLSRLVLFLLCAVPWARQGLACAVATTVLVENQGSTAIRSVSVSDPSGGTNQLPAAGLAPGKTARITLPSCLGVYEVKVLFADGRVMLYPGLNAQNIRQLSVR